MRVLRLYLKKNTIDYCSWPKQKKKNSLVWPHFMTFNILFIIEMYCEITFWRRTQFQEITIRRDLFSLSMVEPLSWLRWTLILYLLASSNTKLIIKVNIYCYSTLILDRNALYKFPIQHNLPKQKTILLCLNTSNVS